MRAALGAGVLAGGIAGAVDGTIAAFGIDSSVFYFRARSLGVWGAIDTAPRVWEGPAGLLGCIAASTLAYATIACALLLVVALVAHPLLRGRAMERRERFFLGLGLGGWLGVEFYWWSRPFLFSGLSSTDPKRLAATLACVILGGLSGFALARIAQRRFTRAGSRLRFALRAGFVATLVGGALFVYIDSRRSHVIGRVNERTRDRANVLVFIVDALRQDELGCYGSERVQTPNIDRLAREGVLFENAFAQAPFTWSSFGSFLTGKYPRRHGLVKMAFDVRMAPNVTLASWLKQAKRLEGGQLSSEDYLNAAFLTGTVSHGSGLVQGFDAYFEALLGHPLVDVHSQWSRLRSMLLPWLVASKLDQRFDSRVVASQAARWLDAHASDRWCALVHYYSTHTPYDPEEEYRRMYVDPAYSGPVSEFRAEHRQAIESGAELTPADADQIRNLYHGGVSMADSMIGDVIAELEKQGILDQTIVVVTSDHGEELGDHGLWEHNFMYETNLRIPFVIRYPARLPAGGRVEAAVDSIDLLPTLCDLLRLEVPHDALDVYGIVDGKSLLPLVRGEVDHQRAYTFAENGPYLSIQGGGWKLIVRREGLEQDGWEKLVSGEIGQSQLFDLVNDPAEHSNLFPHETERAHALYIDLLEWSSSMPIPVFTVEESARDYENQALIKQLGYAGGVGAGTDGGGDTKE